MTPIGGNEELIELLRKTPAVLRALTGPMSGVAAHTRDAEGWSTVEIVGHLIDAEQRAIERIAQLQNEENPVLAGYDQTGMVEQRDYQGRDLESVLSDFERLRTTRVMALEALDEGGWARRATLSTYGEASLRDITIHMCWHDMNHLAQIGAMIAPARERR
ncbi:MAG: DinB family protein [Thermomicrobiales bacterium]